MKEVYLDAHASTAVDPLVLETMIPFFTQYFGNGNHKNGWKAAKALEAARMNVATVLGAYPQEVYFTSGATEAINTGILGLAQLYPRKKHLVTQVTEHSAVLQTVRHLETQGYSVTYLPVDAAGHIDVLELEASIREDTLLVAIMLVNNEIGTIHPIQSIGDLCQKKGTLFFCDATQGVGYHPLDVHASHIDVASISAHKIHGPKGIGALYSRISLPPLIFGGGQERGLRAGTVNVPGAIGLGKACSLLHENREQYLTHVTSLRDRLLHALLEHIEDVHINGDQNHRHPGNINIRIDGLPNELLMARLPDILLSSSSACGANTKTSHVLSAIGLSPEEIQQCLRMGISRTSSVEEIDYAAQAIIGAARRLRRAQPLTTG